MRRVLPRPARAQAGFTLLEAIVAMVIFTLGAFALYGWLATNVITLERVRAQQQREAALATGLDLIRRSNPMEAPEGRRMLGDITVAWTSRPIETRRGMTQTGAPTIYAVGLYQVDARVLRDGAEMGRFSVRQVGWRQVAEVEL